MNNNNSLIGIAGVHHVVSELSRRGLVALPTVKNTAAYDIVVLNVSGTKHANVQVKSSSKKVSFFPMPPPEKIRAGKHDVYVFVRWLDKEQRYQSYLLTGKETKAAVQARIAGQQESIERGTRQKPFPCVYVGRAIEKQARKWESAWNTWNL